MSLRSGAAAIVSAVLRPAGRLVLSPSEPHKPLVELAWPGSCVCGLPAGHPVYGAERSAR